MVVGFDDPAIPPLTVTAYWWSHAACERAADAAGFTHLTWRHLTVTDTGRTRYGNLWDNYLRIPHAVILEAV